VSRILFAIFACLIASNFGLTGCMAGKGMAPTPGGGVSLGGDGVYSAASDKTKVDDKTSPEALPPDAGAPSYHSSIEPIVAAGPAAGSAHVPMFGPDAMPPLSDSESTGHGDEAKAAKAPATPPKTVDTLPEAQDFRLIAGWQPYSTQDPEEKLPAALAATPKVGEPLAHLNGSMFLVQALGDTKPDGTKGPYWWDIARGPTVRMVLQRDGQDLAGVKYVDLPIAYHGLKESGKGFNLNADLSYGFWEGDTISFYLYYEADPSVASTTDYFKKPEGFNEDVKHPASFSSAEAANRFFGDKQHVRLLGSFPVSLDAIERAPEPAVKPDDQPQYRVSSHFDLSFHPSAWLFVKRIFYTKIEFANSYGRKPTSGADYGNPAMLLSFGDGEDAFRDLHFNAQYADLGDCGGSECWSWKPIEDKRYVRVYVERQVGYDTLRMSQDFKVTALAGETANLRLQNVLLKDGDILDFYYYRPAGKPVEYTAELTEKKRAAEGAYDDPYFAKALFMGRFQAKVGSLIRYEGASPAYDFKATPFK